MFSMAAKPLITSPALVRLEKRMAGFNLSLAVHDSAVEAAGTLVKPLRDAARAAGSPAVAREVKVLAGHMNDLVMRDRGHFGDVLVGVDGASPAAEEAEELEWGSLDRGPTGWVRTTAAHEHKRVVETWSAALTKQLDKKVGT